MDHYALFHYSSLLWLVKISLGMGKQTPGVGLKAFLCLMNSTKNHLLYVLDSILFSDFSSTVFALTCGNNLWRRR